VTAEANEVGTTVHISGDRDVKSAGPGDGGAAAPAARHRAAAASASVAAPGADHRVAPVSASVAAPGADDRAAPASASLAGAGSGDSVAEGSGDRNRMVLDLLGGRASTGARRMAALIWLLFIIFPVVNAVGKREPLLEHGLVIGGALLFVASYVVLVLHWNKHADPRAPIALFGMQLAVATALTVGQSPGWGFLFTYCAACAAFISPARLGFYTVVLCAALAGVSSSIGGASSSTALGFVASSVGIGLLMLVMRDLRVRNMELTQARAELARLAVAEERERFARDLHDLLGHSLSVIALKAELAGRMLPDRADAAAGEIADVEQVARNALGEVRDAVSGYRQPTLADELAGARMALSAAAIEASVDDPHVTLDPAVEGMLAWAVREGATNVIRHSGAHHCTLRIRSSATEAAVEVIDDGRGAAPLTGSGSGPDGGSAGDGFGSGPDAGSAGDGFGSGHDAGSRWAGNDSGSRYGSGVGHGLAGLAERARNLHGRLEAGALAEGGFRLAVTIPVSHSR
jgi:two-component system, NarL family, sensor histidine kinase DesK